MCKELHKILVEKFKLADENDSKEHPWIKNDSNKVLKYSGYKSCNKNYGSDNNLIRAKNKNQYENTSIIQYMEIEEAQGNVKSVNYFCKKSEGNDILQFDHTHILR